MLGDQDLDAVFADDAEAAEVIEQIERGHQRFHHRSGLAPQRVRCFTAGGHRHQAALGAVTAKSETEWVSLATPATPPT